MIEIIRINKAKADIKRALKIKNSFNLQMETLEICLEILNNYTYEKQEEKTNVNISYNSDNIGSIFWLKYVCGGKQQGNYKGIYKGTRKRKRTFEKTKQIFEKFKKITSY